MSNYLLDGYHGQSAANASENERLSFIRRTYLHLAVSVAALVGMEFVLFKSGIAGDILLRWFTSPVSLLAVIALFIGGGFLARYLARAEMPSAVKYLALIGYTFLQALFLLPIIYLAMHKMGGDTKLIEQASLITLVTFGGLTLTVFVTKSDFSGLGPILFAAGWAVFAVILAAIIFGFGLGLWISFVCVALAAGYILYDTSNILHHYRTDEHVAASLELLADVVLLFYHILRILYYARN